MDSRDLRSDGFYGSRELVRAPVGLSQLEVLHDLGLVLVAAVGVACPVLHDLGLVLVAAVGVACPPAGRSLLTPLP